MISASANYLTELAKNSRTPIYQVGLTEPTLDIPFPIFLAILDEVSGTRDDTFGGNDLSDNNGVTSVTSVRGIPDYLRAAHFDHHAGQSTLTQRLSVAVGSGSLISRGDRSWHGAAVVRLDSLPNGSLDALDVRRVICGQWDATAQRSWNVMFDPAMGFMFTVWSGTGASEVTVTGIPDGGILTGVWYLVQWWHDADNNVIAIQLDGAPPVAFSTASFAHTSTAIFNVGSDGVATADGAKGWDGDIGEVFIWDVVLTDAQRNRFYNEGNGRAVSAFQIDVAYEFCTSLPLDGFDLGYQLLKPISLDQRAEVERSRMPLYEFIFKLDDLDEVVTGLLEAVDSDLIGWDVKLYAGFYDIEWFDTPTSPTTANHVQLFGGIITEVQYADGVYTVTARNRFAAAQDKLIFNGATTTLTASINSTDTTCDVADTAAFETAAAHPDSMRKLLECEGELFNYLSSTATTFDDLVRPGVDGYSVPPATAPSASHDAGAVVREMIKLQGMTTGNANAALFDDLHPIEQLKSVLTQTGKYGVGESALSSDTANLDAAKAALDPELQMRWIYAEGVNAKKFIEEEIYLACGMYPTCDNTGALKAKLLQGAADASSVDTVTDTDIVAQPKWVRNAERMVNVVVIDLDYIPTTKEYATQFIYRDETLISQVGREIPLEISSKGFRTEFEFGGLTWFETTADFLIATAQRHIDRFGLKTSVVAVQAIFQKQLLEVGDDVELTMSHAINLNDGTRVLTDAPAEVIGMRHLFNEGIIEIEFLLYPPI